MTPENKANPKTSRNLRRDLLDLVCWDEDSYMHEHTRLIDSDRIDALEELDREIDDAQEDGSWTDDRRRRILEQARMRVLGSRSREARARSAAQTFLGGLAPQLQARLKVAVQEETLPERIDRSLAGVANAIESTLPRALRRTGEALFQVKGTNEGHRGSWIQPGHAEEIELEAAVRLQFERLGEVSAELATELTRELFRALENGTPSLPGFGVKRLEDNALALEWRAQGFSAAGSPGSRGGSTPEEVVELIEVSEVVQANSALSKREPEMVHIEAFISEEQPEVAIPRLVHALAERASLPTAAISRRLRHLVTQQMHTFAAQDDATAGRERFDRALARLRVHDSVLGQIASKEKTTRSSGS